MAVSHHSEVIAIDDSSQVGDARRRAGGVARELGFNETECGKLGIIVTEAANNIVKHAGRGQLLLSPIEADGIAGIELLALDKGPGMDDVGRCMEDGYSTAGSPGTGMGAMQRLSHGFDVYSAASKGTVLMARLYAAPPSVCQLETGAVCVPIQGETVSGDGWACYSREKYHALVAVDGLGHGPLAAQAAEAAIAAFRVNPERSPAELLSVIHGNLLSTRGAAVAVACVDGERNLLRFAGIGNIGATYSDGEKTKGLPSQNGTVGHQLRKVHEISYPWSDRAWLVLHSDGLYTRWKLEDYPGLLRKAAPVIAGVLYRDFQRGRDDAMALVAKACR